MTYFNAKALMSIAALSASLALAGCQTTNGNNNALTKGLLGAGAGAIAGAIIGNNAGSDDAQSGALIGAIIGGAGGAYAGCREDGGCGAQPQAQNGVYRNQGHQHNQRHSQAQIPVIDRRQYFEKSTGRYYYYDPQTRQEYYENDERKYR